MNKISILGCGWLGLPLAKSLLSKGYEVKGSTTSESKLDVLKNAGISPFQIQLEEHQIIGNIEEFLKETHVLVIDIPPGLRRETSTSNEMTFVNKVKTLIPIIEKSGVQKVVFVSSTSVYGDSKNFSTALEVTEETTPNPDTESGKQLVISETLLQSNAHFKTTVIRFGGLLGDDRHPVKFLAGRTNIENPEAPVNMIQREDCIGIIEKALDFARDDNWEWNQTFNAVSPQHPTRKAYYHKKAEILNLPLPTFAENSESKGKIISSKKVETILGYSFQKEI
ncbi:MULTISPECIES: SDR family oxidoreductase [unclassified Flavobacterium]|uniref:SDR family oxidoreductase n=1 Tax=unclassified Flavobacterium TaxID=196869 RepID=UPI001291A078|nr:MULTISPECIES: SDR family oxidoreductase [unclassified Flavobacterium]MQP51428.1 NAD(P)H-binding protein [Flavobacterium sp. LMO9]MQP61344.1 NAD(P)H-binding protein [Flavobacterium sp. LMO6]